MNESWIGFDLDGTLAYYDQWKGEEHIGDPIPSMKKLLLKHISEGETVKIFTARASLPKSVQAIKAWLVHNGMPELEVTDRKDYKMKFFYDDRCIQVRRNQGEVLLCLS